MIDTSGSGQAGHHTGEESPRDLGVAVLAGIGCGALTLVAASRTWSAVTVTAPGAPVDRVAVTGIEAVPLIGALALVVLAGSAAILPTGGVVRRVVGGLLALAGLAAAVLAVSASGAVREALDSAIAESPTAFAAAGTAAAPEIAWWRWVVIAAALGGSAVGGATAWQGHTWVVMGRRYQAPTTAAPDPDDDPWRAMDAGHDPTR